MEKVATAEKKTDQAVHWRLVRNDTSCAQMLFDKDIMIKRHIDIYADLSESPLFVYQRRKHKQWGLISINICNVYSVKYFPDYFAKNIQKKRTL